MLNHNERANYNAIDHPDYVNIHGQGLQYPMMIPRPRLDEDTNLLDRVIEFAFETLGARHLQLHVYDEV